MECISTSNGPYEFAAVQLSRGRGALDSEASKANLLLLQQVFDEREIPFGIIYGTLLGAVREGAFIPWDEDVDVFLLDEHRSAFFDALHDLRAAGLDLVRSDGDLYSLMRGDDYIDVYVFRRCGNRRMCNEDTVAARHLENSDWLSFLGSRFRVPSSPESFLRSVYGKDWRTPKRDAPARPWSLGKRIREGLKVYFPVLVRIKRVLNAR